MAFGRRAKRTRKAAGELDGEGLGSDKDKDLRVRIQIGAGWAGKK